MTRLADNDRFSKVWACEARVQHVSDKEPVSITVAVKTLKDNASQEEKRDFLSELSIMKLLDPHPNIVTLLGCCTEKGNLEDFRLSTLED